MILGTHHMIQVGFIGWRSLVGKVLRQRLTQEQDLRGCIHRYYSTTQAGNPAPPAASHPILEDANDLQELAKNNIIISTQGSAFTEKTLQPLRQNGWDGYWIDAASHARLHPNSTLALDPINHASINHALSTGNKDFIGANCTVSLMLLALAGLLKDKLINHIFVSSYQAISGAGSQAIEQLLTDQSQISAPPSLDCLEKISHIEKLLPSNSLAYNLHPWIDSEDDAGYTKEELKAHVETEKILGYHIPIENTCVRVPSLRCHSQALCVDLNAQLSLPEIINKLATAHPWADIIPNTQHDTLRHLGPTASSNQLNIRIGRLRLSKHNPQRLHIFTTADQLLWGAAEPLRRVFTHIKNHIHNN